VFFLNNLNEKIPEMKLGIINFWFFSAKDMSEHCQQKPDGDGGVDKGAELDGGDAVGAWAAGAGGRALLLGATCASAALRNATQRATTAGRLRRPPRRAAWPAARLPRPPAAPARAASSARPLRPPPPLPARRGTWLLNVLPNQFKWYSP